MKRNIIFALLGSLMVITTVNSANVAGTAGVKTIDQTGAIAACQPGYRYDSTSCIACSSAGQTANHGLTGVNEANSPQSTDCIACPAGYYCAKTVGGSGVTSENVPTQCPDGTGSPEGSSAVTDCISCVLLGCQTCSISVTGETQTASCNLCGLPGYFPIKPSGVPLTCSKCNSQSGGCGICEFKDGVQTCAGCNPNGYYQTDDTLLTCKPCLKGCASCPNGVDGPNKCLTVSKGYYLSADAPALPKLCGGLGFTTELGTEKQCNVACTDTNCLTCNSNQNKCEWCKPNFQLSFDGQCTEVPIDKIHITCKTVNAPNDNEACTDCIDDNFREMEKDTTVVPNIPQKYGQCVCKAGYGDTSTASVPVAKCSPCGGTVMSCDLIQKLALLCTSTTQYPAGADCKTKDATDAVGYYFDKITNKFENCDSTCVQCTAKGTTGCQTCAPLPDTWVEPTASSANYQIFIKGKRWFSNSTCYDNCPIGYVADSAHANCIPGLLTNGSPIGSFALILLISILFSIL